ncbi:MAG: vitamin K epoxide reductase family protein [Thermodesulfobacteriota bacterium]
MTSGKRIKGNYLKPAVLVLSALGVLLSLYLAVLYFTETQAAFCASGSECDAVRQSAFSSILGVPVAAFGVIGYSIIFLITVISMTKRTKWTLLYIFALAGFVFSAYLTYIELFVINAVCMYCIFSAVLMTIIFIVLLAAKSEFNPKLSPAVTIMLSLAVTAVVVLGAALVQAEKFGESARQHSGYAGPANEFQIGLAKYLTNNGAVMYGSFKCPHCSLQKELFGGAVKYVTYVECHPKGPNANPSLCFAKGIVNYPTWEINGKYYEGTMPLEQISEIAGYNHPQ